MSQPEPLIFSRCPVLASTAGVAAQLGYLENDSTRRSGIDLLLRQQSAEPVSPSDPSLHPTRYWLRHGPNQKAVWARAHGSDDRLVGLSWFQVPAQILVLPGSDIQSPSDLKGKRLLVPTQKNYLFDGPRVTALHLYEVALSTVGLTFDDVTLVEVPQPAGAHQADWTDPRSLWTLRRRAARGEFAQRAVQDGEADAFISQISFAIEGAAATGARVIFDAATLPDRRLQAGAALPLLLVASGALVRERRDVLVGLIADLLRASRWSQQNLDGAIRLTARDLGSDELTTEYTYGAGLGLELDVNFDPQSLAALDAVKASYLRYGLFANDFNVTDWIERGPLEEAHRLLESENSSETFLAPQEKGNHRAHAFA
jgi:ABC-type nitrate/sulfonate/bicarbonate transport system substrate-binding protein